MKLEKLSAITDSTPLDQLDEAQIRELQSALSRLGHPVGEIDGLLGPKTRNAWAEFMTDVVASNPNFIGSTSVAALQEKLDELGEGKGFDFSTKDGTIEAIKSECSAQGIGLKPQMAYVLATVEWETNKTFKPVKEAYWLSEDWRRANLRYYPYYGRGFVQLTWKNNYATYGQLLGVDLVNEPDLALNPDTALFVLVHGFKTGTFTGRRISDYINAGTADFVNARRCINGTDHAHDIAQLAEKYLQGLT